MRKTVKRVLAVIVLSLFVGAQHMSTVQAAVNYEACPFCGTRVDRYITEKRHIWYLRRNAQNMIAVISMMSSTVISVLSVVRQQGVSIRRTNCTIPGLQRNMCRNSITLFDMILSLLDSRDAPESVFFGIGNATLLTLTPIAYKDKSKGSEKMKDYSAL